MAWPRRFRTFWCAVDSQGTAYLSTARENRSRSIAAWVAAAGDENRNWAWWRRNGMSCQRLDIKVRNADQ